MSVSGEVSRSAGRFSIRFDLFGRPGDLALPARATVPVRADRLWETTCFEFFLAPADSPGYWEFNLSPSGCWNVYGFSGYREGMHEEGSFTSLPFEVALQADVLSVGLETDIGGILGPERAVDIGTCAVLEGEEGDLSYWAPAHFAARPDFHRRGELCHTAVERSLQSIFGMSAHLMCQAASGNSRSRHTMPPF